MLSVSAMGRISLYLKESKAQWHKGCQAELAPSKLKCALESAANKKRKIGELPVNAPSKRTGSNRALTPSSTYFLGILEKIPQIR